MPSPIFWHEGFLSFSTVSFTSLHSSGMNMAPVDMAVSVALLHARGQHMQPSPSTTKGPQHSAGGEAVPRRSIRLLGGATATTDASIQTRARAVEAGASRNSSNALTFGVHALEDVGIGNVGEQRKHAAADHTHQGPALECGRQARLDAPGCADGRQSPGPA